MCFCLQKHILYLLRLVILVYFTRQRMSRQIRPLNVPTRSGLLATPSSRCSPCFVERVRGEQSFVYRFFRSACLNYNDVTRGHCKFPLDVVELLSSLSSFSMVAALSSVPTKRSQKRRQMFSRRGCKSGDLRNVLPVLPRSHLPPTSGLVQTTYRWPYFNLRN